ncbi:hypothetical protein CR513_57493, partial [Mucuna pruriens]
MTRSTRQLRYKKIRWSLLYPNQGSILTNHVRSVIIPNYLQWVQYVHTTLKGYKKLSHIEGGGSLKDDQKFEVWDDEDFLIMIWLWNSMTPEISQNNLDIRSLKWVQYVHTTLKGYKKLSHIEGGDSLKDDPKFEVWDDEDFLIMI